MANVALIPCNPPCVFDTNIGDQACRLRVFFSGQPDGGGWALDLMDSHGNPLACGVNMVPNADLLAPFEYLGFSSKLVLYAPDETAVGFADWGTGCNLYTVAV